MLSALPIMAEWLALLLCECFACVVCVFVCGCVWNFGSENVIVKRFVDVLSSGLCVNQLRFVLFAYSLTKTHAHTHIQTHFHTPTHC